MNERTFKPSEIRKLEDPERLTWLPPDEAVREFAPAAGARVADIGAGSGYFTLPLARAVGPSGRVYAVDLQAEMLDFLRARLEGAGAPRNVEPRQGTAAATGIESASCDLVFLANVWHELDERAEVLVEAARILAPGGRIGILDWRTGVERPPGPPLDHRVSAEETAGLLAAGGWLAPRTVPIGRYSYLVIAGLGKLPI